MIYLKDKKKILKLKKEINRLCNEYIENPCRDIRYYIISIYSYVFCRALIFQKGDNTGRKLRTLKPKLLRINYQSLNWLKLWVTSLLHAVNRGVSRT